MRRAFTLIELLVVISIIALLIAILLPALSSARQTAEIMQNATHQRGIHQAFVMYGHNNKGLYPGLSKNGTQGDILQWKINGEFTSSSQRGGQWPSTRFALIVDEELVSPEYVINPADPYTREAWTYGKTGTDSYGTAFDWHNFSYAVEEWGHGATGMNRYKLATGNIDDMGSETPVVADRILDVLNDDFSNPQAYIGVYSSRPGEFKMGLAWNDGHTTIQNSPVVDTRFGQYRNEDDNIYMRGSEDTGVTSTPSAPTGTVVDSKFAYQTPSSHQSPDAQ